MIEIVKMLFCHKLLPVADIEAARLGIGNLTAMKIVDGRINLFCFGREVSARFPELLFEKR